jgi:hypothetical protein
MTSGLNFLAAAEIIPGIGSATEKSVPLKFWMAGMRIILFSSSSRFLNVGAITVTL